MSTSPNCASQKEALALAASLGGTDAKKRLKEITAEIAKLAFEIDDLGVAASHAEVERAVAEKNEAVEGERERRRRISKTPGLYPRARLRRRTHGLEKRVSRRFRRCPAQGASRSRSIGSPWPGF